MIILEIIFEVMLAQIPILIGAFLKWIYLKIYNRIKDRKAVPFALIWSGRDREGLQNSFERQISNAFLGWVVIVLIIALMIWH